MATPTKAPYDAPTGTKPPSQSLYDDYPTPTGTGGTKVTKPTTPAAPPTDPNSLTALLADFGIQYPNAPAPTPALLAFMRGLGMNMATAEDIRRQGLETVKARTTSTQEDISRGAGRAKQATTADLVRRGVLRSGEANTRFARQDEDVAVKRADVERGRTEATQGIENAYEQTRGAYRQQALERVLSSEEQQSTQAAASKAQEEAFKRQEAASATEFERQKQLNEENLTKMEALYAKYGAQGVAL